MSLKKDASGINTLRENGILKTDTLDKANICNRQFQSAFTRESDDEIPSKGTSPFTAMGEITVDPNGVIKLLNNLNIHKAPGPDGLSARVLKECSSEIAPVLTYIFNESLAQGAVPDDWRQANVAPVFKKGEKYDAANYRPVSLTCICCKTLEHIIVSNINKHLALENILADCQHGFRSQRSCETQLVQFINCPRLSELKLKVEQILQQLGISAKLTLKTLIFGYKTVYPAYNHLNRLLTHIFYAIFKFWVKNEPNIEIIHWIFCELDYWKRVYIHTKINIDLLNKFLDKW